MDVNVKSRLNRLFNRTFALNPVNPRFHEAATFPHYHDKTINADRC